MNSVNLLRNQFETIARSANQYPVDFDEAWQWIGYSRKDNALVILKNNFEEETDFCSCLFRSKKGSGGHNEVKYSLTVDCFKSFCMMAGTDRGKEVRKYYLAVEKALLDIYRYTPAPVSDFSSEVRQLERFLNVMGLNVKLVQVKAEDIVE